MRTSASQLQWMKLWVLRILFFPVWMWAINRRERRALTVEVEVNGVKQKMSDVTYKLELDNDANYQRYLVKYPKTEPKTSHWAIQLLDQRGCILGQEEAHMADEDDGIVLRADFDIRASITIVKSRALRRNKIIGENTLPTGPIAATYGDIIKISHALVVETRKECAEVEYKEETPKNPDLRGLKLLTSMSNLVKAHGHEPNKFYLFDNGDTECLGAEVKARFDSWYPKAIWTKKDGSIRTTYDLDSALFKDIKKKADAGGPASALAMYGCELVWELEGGELVTMFCGTKNMRRAVADVKRVHGTKHTLNAVAVDAKNFQWVTVEFTPFVPEIPKWQGTELYDLDAKHLWNIVQAIKNGQWANGSKVRFNPTMKKALLTEYDYRDDAGAYTKKKVKKIKKQNKKWEVAEAARRQDVQV